MLKRLVSESSKFIVMKLFFTLYFASVCAVGLMAQNEASDSIKTQELNDVVVEAQMQRNSSTSTTYIPSRRQKNAAQNAIDLLQQMAIPQIQINPIDKKVTDNFGGDVAIYINHLPASKEEMDGLRTVDVRKVEYLEFPTDPRFRGQQRVVNIIVQEYAYGGYTRLSVSEDFLLGVTSMANLYSKFSYKRMTYDTYFGANNYRNSHDGSSSQSVYSLLKDGKAYSVNRNETLLKSRFSQNQYPLTFRATYNSEKIQIRNTVGYQYVGNPRIRRSGTLDCHPEFAESYTYERNNPQWSNSVSYSGSYYFSLPRNFSIDVAPTFNHTHTNNNLDYTASNSVAISRYAKENAYNFRIDGYLRKSIGQKHSLLLGINGGHWCNRLHYSGTNVHDDKFSNSFVWGMAGYNLQTHKLAVGLDAGIIWENSDINGYRIGDCYPVTHINVIFSPNSRNKFSAYFQYANNTAGVTEKASDILQEHELLYISGNPDLKNSRHTTANLAYTWWPSNAFAMSVYGQFFGLYNRQFRTYEHYNGGEALIRTWINDGDYLSGKIGMAFNWKLLGGNLQFYANPELSLNKTTGICPLTFNPFNLNVQLTYYLKRFYFRGLFMLPQKGMMFSSNTTYHNRHYYGLTAGWSDANWNISLSAYNMFNKGWKNSVWELHTPLYGEVRTNYGNYNHPRINLSVTYTFGYGKKVQRGNEVGAQQGADSAILK